MTVLVAKLELLMVSSSHIKMSHLLIGAKKKAQMQVEKQILMDFIIYFKSTFEEKIL